MSRSSAPTDQVAAPSISAWKLVLPGEEDVGARLVGGLDEDQDQDADPDACERRQDEAPRCDDRLQCERQLPDDRAENGRQDADRDRPQELGSGRASCGRDVRDRERERPEPGPVVEADVDQRPDACREQPRHEHDAHQRSAEPARLHEQEGAGERRAEQRRDCGEAPGGADHDARHLRRVALDQVHGEHAHAAADRDQRRFGAEHDAEAEGGERREDDPGRSIGRTAPPVLKPSAGLCPEVPGR